VRSLRNKLTEFYNGIISSKFDVVIISETWLNDSVLDNELCNSSYYIFRSDRDFITCQCSRGGGVLVAVSTAFVVERIDLNNTDFSLLPNVDIVCVKISIPKTSILYIFALYVPPNSSIDVYVKLFDSFESLDFVLNKNVIIIGDFNISHYVLALSGVQDNKSRIFLEFCNYMGFHQNNNIANDFNRILDLVCSNKKCVVSKAVDILCKEDVHHPPLHILYAYKYAYKYDTSVKGISSKKQHFNFLKADFVAINKKLSDIDWSFLKPISDTDVMMEAFYSKLNDIFSICVPRSLRFYKSKYPPWFNSSIVKQLRQKHKLWLIYKQSKSPLFYDEFKSIRKIIKLEIKRAHCKYILQVEQNITKDPKSFWSYIDCIKKNNFIPTYMTFNDKELQTPTDIANGFADFFQQTYTSSSTAVSDNNHFDMYSRNSGCLTIPTFTVTNMSDAIKKLKTKKSSGPDGIPAFVIKNICDNITTPLTIIFNRALSSSTFPAVFKNSIICPIYKKGDRKQIHNYRPVVLLSSFAKVFEILLHDTISPFVKNQLSNFQHGFVKGRSTVTNLCSFVQFVADCMNDRSQVDVVFTDLSKAFDTIDHPILLEKLSKFGLCTNFVEFFRSYFSGRCQYVNCAGFQSHVINVSSGVPQGSILGPLLFNVFINNIADVVDSQILLYADDFKIYSRIDHAVDCLRMQDTIDEVVTWCNSNGLKLNKDKCCIMSFTRKTQPIHHHYTLDISDLQRCTKHVDLGITLDSNLSFSDHVEGMVTRSVRSLGFVIRNSRIFNNADTVKRLYFAFVRSKLEYASVVWSTGYKSQIEDLEKIQRRLLKYLSFKVDGTYPENGHPQHDLLGRWNVDSLLHRRVCHSLIFYID
jgi:hypothetical protein